MDQQIDPTQKAERELVAFRAGEQDYCVDIGHVREIRGWTEATSLPHAPDYVRGVINLRGSVVPIVDLAARLGLQPTKASDRNVIIIMVVSNQVVGILVEAVFDILSVHPDTVQDTPELASDMVRAFIEGVVTIEERMIRLIDLDRLLQGTGQEAA